MPDDPLRTLIDGMRTRLHDELEAQLQAMSETHARALEETRRAAHDEAERRWTAQLEAARLEWNTRLQAEVASVRSESERALIAETMRARVQAEQAAAASTSTARRELEESFAAERRRLEEQLAAERVRAEAASSERDRLTGEHGRLAAERDTLAAQRETLAAELETHRHRIAELETGHQQHAAVLATEHGRMGDLEAEVERLSTELAAARMDLLSRQGAAPAAAVAPDTGESEGHGARLATALREMDEAGSLSEVLAACARAAAAAAPRAALFIVQGSELREWPVDGVRSVDAGPLRVDGREAGLMADALRRHEPVTTSGRGGPTAPFFATLPQDGTAVAVPLVLAGTPVAVLYADQGTADASGGGWTTDVQIVGRHAAACAAALTALRTTQAMRYLAESPRSSSGTDAADADAEVQGARRYARLLVSEIKLYNEGAVRLGRERRDLLTRLEPEIGRARRLFDDRVLASVPGRDAIFTQELAQTLADGDVALLGSGARLSTP